MKSELTRERLQTGLCVSLLLFQALACSPESFLGLENVLPGNKDPACHRSAAWFHPCLGGLLQGLMETTGRAQSPAWEGKCLSFRL